MPSQALLVFASLLAAGPAHAAPSDDIAALETLILEVHPDPYGYSSEAAVRAIFETERARLDALPQPTELEVGAAIYRSLAWLGDAHTYVGLPMMQPESTTPVSLLPLLPVEAGGQLLVDASTLDLPAGTEIESIDGQRVDALLDALSALVPADGRDPDAIRRQLLFDLPLYFALEFGMHDRYALQLRLPDGTLHMEEAAGVDRAGIGALRAARQVPDWWGQPTPDRLPGLSRVQDVAVLRVPTMGYPNMGAFKDRVDALFAALSSTEPLIIDLRGNEGGLRPNSFAILDHLLSTPYVEWTRMRVARRRVPRHLQGGLVWPYGTLEERLGNGFQRLTRERGFALVGDPLASRAHPSAAVHTGPVSLLVNARTGSAANGFVLVARRYRPEVRIIGEPLGGACDRHVGELPVVWTGPETGLHVMFSLIEATHVAVEGCVPGHGLAPDVRVEPDLDDLVEGRDPWLSRALQEL